jgi:hypothetical protein
MDIIPADKLTEIPNISGYYGESVYEGDISKSYFIGLITFFVKQKGLELSIENKYIDRNRKEYMSKHNARFSIYFPSQKVAEIKFDTKTPLNSVDALYSKLYLYPGTQRITAVFNPFPYFFLAAPLKYKFEKTETVNNSKFLELINKILSCIDMAQPQINEFNAQFTWIKEFQHVEIFHLKLSSDFLIVKGNLAETDKSKKIEEIINSSPLVNQTYYIEKQSIIPNNLSLPD